MVCPTSPFSPIGSFRRRAGLGQVGQSTRERVDTSRWWLGVGPFDFHWPETKCEKRSQIVANILKSSGLGGFEPTAAGGMSEIFKEPAGQSIAKHLWRVQRAWIFGAWLWPHPTEREHGRWRPTGGRLGFDCCFQSIGGNPGVVIDDQGIAFTQLGAALPLWQRRRAALAKAG